MGEKIRPPNLAEGTLGDHDRARAREDLPRAGFDLKEILSKAAGKNEAADERPEKEQIDFPRSLFEVKGSTGDLDTRLLGVRIDRTGVLGSIAPLEGLGKNRIGSRKGHSGVLDLIERPEISGRSQCKSRRGRSGALCLITAPGDGPESVSTGIKPGRVEMRMAFKGKDREPVKGSQEFPDQKGRHGRNPKNKRPSLRPSHIPLLLRSFCTASHRSRRPFEPPDGNFTSFTCTGVRIEKTSSATSPSRD
jgi:hypothetical protein